LKYPELRPEPVLDDQIERAVTVEIGHRKSAAIAGEIEAAVERSDVMLVGEVRRIGRHRPAVMSPCELSVDDVAILDQFQITHAERDSFDFLNIMVVIGEDLGAKDLVNDQTKTRLAEVRDQIMESWTVVWMGVE